MRTRSSARGKASPPKPDDDVEMLPPPAAKLPSPIPKLPPPAPKLPPPVKRRRKIKWDSPTVLTSEKSPLAKCDLRTTLQHQLAWDVLTPAERAVILSHFPDETHVLGAGTDAARPDLGSLLNDNNFRHDCARYAEGLSNGWHEEHWLWEAWEAWERRRTGEFDEVLERGVEEEWGVTVGGEVKSMGGKVKSMDREVKSMGEEDGEGETVSEEDGGDEKSAGEEGGETAG